MDPRGVGAGVLGAPGAPDHAEDRTAPEAAPRGRSRSLRLLLAGALSLVPLTACGGGGRRGQAPGATPATVTALSPDARVDLPGRVSVFLKVTEGDGSPAADLTGADFNVYENEQLVSQTESAQRLVAQPQVFRSYLHLILGRSNSVQSAGAAEVQEGARQFIEAVTAEPENFVKISWFDGSPMIHEISGFDFGFSNDRELLLAAIDALDNEPPFSTSTNLYGAVVDGISALDEVDVSAANTGVENRSLTLVTFTDGTHQAGPAVTLQDALDAIDGVSPEERSTPRSPSGWVRSTTRPCSPRWGPTGRPRRPSSGSSPTPSSRSAPRSGTSPTASTS